MYLINIDVIAREILSGTPTGFYALCGLFPWGASR